MLPTLKMGLVSKSDKISSDFIVYRTCDGNQATILLYYAIHVTLIQEYPSKMRMKPLQTVHPLHGELLMDKKPKVTDPFFKISCEEYYQPKPTSTENVLTKYKSSECFQFTLLP